MQNPDFSGLLLVSDIDGTLSSLDNIPQKNIEAIRCFTEHGGIFTLCTGRPKCSVNGILKQIEVNAPVITINGGYIYSPKDNSTLFEAFLPEDIESFVFDVLEHFSYIGAMMVEPDHYWVIRWGDESIKGVADRRKMYEHNGCCCDFYQDGAPKRWDKVVFIVPPDCIEEVRAYVQQKNPQGFYPVRTDEFYLELVPENIGKGKGMELVKEKMGAFKTAAIGDRENDRSMILAADFSAVPKDAEKNLQKEVDFIVDSCDNGAVADFIAKLGCIYKPKAK